MNSMKRLAGGAAFAVLALAAASAVHAQETTGGIRGQLTDGAGAPVAGATVKVTHVPSGTTVTSVTSTDGSYDVRNLRAGGPYTVVASQPAFETKTVNIESIAVGAPFQLSFALPSVGSVEELVVTAASAGGTTVTTGPVSSFTAQDVATLPSFNRDLKDLARLNPFVTIDPTNSNAMLVAGQNNRVNSVYVDGIKQADDFGLNGNGYATSSKSPISTDWVQAFNLEVAPYDVQYGEFQGGVMNVVTKSGGNEFHGGAYAEYDSQRMSGSKYRTADGLRVSTVKPFEDKTWGGYVSGPIIKDRVYFFGGYEKYEYTAPAGTFGPTDSAAANKVPGITDADVTRIQNILKSTYNFDPLGYSATTSPQEDKKYFLKLDANLTDKHRLVLSYQKQETSSTVNGGTNSTATSGGSLALLSQYYAKAEELEVKSGQLFSQWTDNFSTAITYAEKHVSSTRSPLAGADFAQFRINLPTGAIVYLGPDISSQYNILDNTTKNFKFKANYQLQDHVFTVGVENEKLKVFNAFLQNATGAYTFSAACGAGDVFTNLTNKQACALTYANASDNVSAHAAANWDSTITTLYAQDEWNVTPDLIVRTGVRTEFYSADTAPKLNTRFQTQYGFGNDSTFDGKYIVMPRVGFNWRPDRSLTVSGGFGLFSGGSPNVWLSNSFSNTGNLVGSISYTCTATNTATCSTALSNVDGRAVSTVAQTANTASTVAGTGITNAVDPSFKIPSVWKYSVSLNKTFDAIPYMSFAGSDWNVHADVIYQKTQNGITWVDLWADQNPAQRAPDGRPTYSRTRFTNALGRTTGYDLMLTNTKKGGGLVWAVGGGKSWHDGWADGLDFDVTYTHQDIKDTNPGSSSVALSNYSQWAISDRDNAEAATSNYQIKYQTKVTAGYSHAFFGDYKTSFRLYGQRRAGLPFSYTYQMMSAPGGSSTLSSSANYDLMFGESAAVGYRNTQLIYVPKADSTGNITATSDPLVTYGAGFDVAALNTFLKTTGLADYGGKISPRNAFKSRDITTIDIRLMQELPAFFPGGSKLKAYVDLINVGNMINNKWGALEQYGFPYTLGTIQARNCQYAASACTAGVGNFYQYDKLTKSTTTSNNNSAWYVKVGLKYEF